MKFPEKNNENFKKTLEETLTKNKDNLMLQQLLKNPQVQNAFKNLSPQDIEKIRTLLNNPDEAKKILATKEAKDKLNDMINTK